MSFENQGAYRRTGGLNYAPCHYGDSKTQFRGPKRPLSGTYIACLGGTDTYGKFVPQPFPALIEAQTGLRVVNFGCVNAGADLYVNDPMLIDAAARAAVTVVQVMGAQNMSNRFYLVHPRRNDRFLRPSAMMRALFPEVDFTEFHFTRHMLSILQTVAPEKFSLVTEELKQAWVARMRQILISARKPSVLLWARPAADGADTERAEVQIGPDPWLVDQAMIDAIRSEASEVVIVDPSEAARAAGTTGMVFEPQEENAAAGVSGPVVHAEIAAALTPAILRHVGGTGVKKPAAQGATGQSV